MSPRPPKSRHSLRDLSQFVPHVAVLLLVYTSAGAFVPRFYALSIVLLAVLSLALTFILPQRQSVAVAVLPIFVLSLLISLVLLVALLTGDPNMGPYIAIPLILSSAYLLARQIPLDLFSEAYVVIVSTLALISLIFTVAALTLPALPLELPRVSGEYVDYANAYVHVFILQRGYGAEGVPLPRNTGVFWEPGAYQAILALGLLFLLSRVDRLGIRRRDPLLLVILAATVGSTASIAGLISISILLVSYRATLVTILRRIPFGGRVGLAGLLLIYSSVALRTSSFSSLGQRLSAVVADGASSALDRVAFDRLAYVDPTLPGFLGISFSGWEATGLSLWNSVIHTTITLGMPFTLILLGMYVTFSRLFPGHACAALAVLLVAFFTEPLLWRPLFVFCAFAALVGYHRFAQSDSLNYRRPAFISIAVQATEPGLRARSSRNRI